MKGLALLLLFFNIFNAVYIDFREVIVLELDLNFLITVVFRSFLAVIIGILIGSERARHGRAAGMRTHILVCVGSALTSMISIYAQQFLSNNGDVLRLSAQVISGIGFLGAGMIILKNNNVITGLTTAAGVWATSVIGIAVGCGFYAGAIVATFFCLLTVILLGKFEKSKKITEVIYVEIDDMYMANELVERIKSENNLALTFHSSAPKSGFQGHLGIYLIIDTKEQIDINKLLETEHIVYAEIE